MYGSHPPTRADVLGLGKQGGSCTFSTPPAILVQFGAITLGASPISKLRAADDGRREAERNSLADRLTVEVKPLPT
jgi:hypothetical protein